MESGEPETPIGPSREMSRRVCWWHSYSGSSKREIRLEECAVHPRLRWQSLGIAVLALKACVVRDVIPQPKDGLDQILIGENLFAQRRVRMLKAVVGLQCLFKPRQPVSDLHVVCLIVGNCIGQNVPVIDVRE